MKLKSLLFICCLSLINTAFAIDRHIHPNIHAASLVAKTTQNQFTPGFCEIEIKNQSDSNVTVYGTFDDGSTLMPFDVYSFQSPRFISLFYYDYCHRDMYLDIVTFSGYHIYSGYTRVDTVVTITPYLTNQLKVETHAK